jgi:hypothetical protein
MEGERKRYEERISTPLTNFSHTLIPHLHTSLTLTVTHYPSRRRPAPLLGEEARSPFRSVCGRSLHGFQLGWFTPGCEHIVSTPHGRRSKGPFPTP